MFCCDHPIPTCPFILYLKQFFYLASLCTQSICADQLRPRSVDALPGRTRRSASSPPFLQLSLALFQSEFIFVDCWQSVYSSPSEVVPLSGSVALILAGNSFSNTSLDHTLLFYGRITLSAQCQSLITLIQPSPALRVRWRLQHRRSVSHMLCAAGNLRSAVWFFGYPGNIPYLSLLI